jgi:circadian clock protein KaiB
MDKDNKNKLKEFEEALETRKVGEKYILRLFVAGINPQSQKAIANLKEFIDDNLDEENYELEIIDIYQQPIFAKEGKIIAAPTLIKELPPPLRRFVGDLSNRDRLLIGLDLRSKRERK